MPETADTGNESPRVKNRRVHMANERTFLAWIRTSIGIMAFGFVVERFALFMRRIAYFIEMSGGKPGISGALPSTGYSSAFGIFLVGLGALLGFFSLIRFRTVAKQIDEDSYRPPKVLDFVLALSVLATGIFLIFYLTRSIR